ncbi:MAG: DUF1045 domain-containing protein [Hyphomicrobiaceae bacterium]
MRYALYFVPDPTSSLWAFGSSVLGYDSQAGVDVPLPSIALFREASARDMTAAARTYGFHATLKAPFELVAGCHERDLIEAVQGFAVRRSPVPIGRLAVCILGKFCALVPEAEQPAGLTQFGAACVEMFDHFRAPLTAADRARRITPQTSAAERANVEKWGYPYVFDTWRFHMTLSGPLPDHQRQRFRDAVSGLYAPISASVSIDAVALCVQPSRDQRFKVLNRFALRGRSDQP